MSASIAFCHRFRADIDRGIIAGVRTQRSREEDLHEQMLPMTSILSSSNRLLSSSSPRKGRMNCCDWLCRLSTLVMTMNTRTNAPRPRSCLDHRDGWSGWEW